MFVVPLTGDTVGTEGGVKHTVLAYAAYKNQPAVYVESDTEKSESVLFSEIQSINGTPVSMTPSGVFKADSLIKRKAQLPQTGDKIVGDGTWLKVKALKLRDHGKLTDGLLVVCEDPDTKEQVLVRAAAVERIKRADGGDESMRKFLQTYKEYLGRSAPGFEASYQ